MTSVTSQGVLTDSVTPPDVDDGIEGSESGQWDWPTEKIIHII